MERHSPTSLGSLAHSRRRDTLAAMNTSAISAASPLPVFVTNEQTGATSIPEAFQKNTKWEIRTFSNPETLTILEIQGTWALCSLVGKPEEQFWTNLSGSQFHGWFPTK